MQRYLDDNGEFADDSQYGWQAPAQEAQPPEAPAPEAPTYHTEDQAPQESAPQPDYYAPPQPEYAPQPTYQPPAPVAPGGNPGSSAPGDVPFAAGQGNSADTIARINAELGLTPSPLSGWGSVQAGDLGRAWTDWAQQQYGTSSSRGAGFANLPAGVSLQDAVAAFNRATGAHARYVGGPSGDQVDFGGGPTDVLTSGGQLWSAGGGQAGDKGTGVPGAGGGATAAPRPTTPGGAPSPAGRTTVSGGNDVFQNPAVAGTPGGTDASLTASRFGGTNLQAPQGIWSTDFINQLRSLIQERLRGANSPVNENDPYIRDPLVAARDEASRQTDAERTALAEHLYAKGGLNTEALTQGIQQSSERNATGLGTLRANLIANEYKQRRQELESILQMALAAGDAQSARDVQMQISALQAQLQREGLGVTLAINSANQNANTVGAGAGGV